MGKRYRWLLSHTVSLSGFVFNWNMFCTPVLTSMLKGFQMTEDHVL